MTDIALENAVARASQIKLWIEENQAIAADIMSNIEKARQDLEKTQSFIRTWYEMAGIQAPLEVEQEESDTPTARRRPKNPDREFVVDKSLEIIRERRAPVPRKELFDALAKRGIVIQGKDPEMVLSTMLWRTQDRVVRLPQHGYWPADVSFDDAMYIPGLDDLMGSAAREPEGGMEAEDVE